MQPRCSLHQKGIMRWQTSSSLHGHKRRTRAAASRLSGCNPLSKSTALQRGRGFRCGAALDRAAITPNVPQGYDLLLRESTTPPPSAEVVAYTGPVMKRFATSSLATVMISPPPATLLSPNPLLVGVTSIALTVAAARGFFKTSRADAEELLLEAATELEHAHRVLVPAEAQLRARAESALALAEAAEAQARLGRPATRATLLQLESSVAEVAAGMQQRQAAAAAAQAPRDTATSSSTGAAAQDRPAAPAWTSNGQRAATPKQAPAHSAPQPPSDLLTAGAPLSENGAGGPDSSRVPQIMARVQNIFAELERHEQKQMLEEQQQEHGHTASPVAAGISPPAATTAHELPTEAATQPPAASPRIHSHTEPAAATAAAASVHAESSISGHMHTAQAIGSSAAAASAVPAPATAASPHNRFVPLPAPPSPWDPQCGPPPEPSNKPSASKGPEATAAPRGVQERSLTQLKCSLLDVVYGTARGVSASLNQRGNVEELVSTLEARNPNCMVKEALGMLHGRWKLVYTTHTPTLMLLKAIQSVPLVDIGDVYQLVDATTLTARNKIDLALPVAMSLRADSGMEVRTPHSFQVRFQRIGLDTFIQTPQLLVSLEVPDSITVLGHTVDLEPLRRYLVEPMQSGVNQAQELLRRAASPDLELPALLESSSLWMMTTYLDDSLRISRDDAGATFVMLRDA